MNIIELQDNLKDLPDRVLMQEMQMPTGNMPQFLVLSELTRRRRMREDYNRQMAADMPTVAEEVITAAGVSPSGITAVVRNMAPNSSIAQNTGADMAVQREPTRAPQMMAEGGILSMANGGGIRSGTITNAIANLKINFPELYEQHKNEPEILEQLALSKLEGKDKRIAETELAFSQVERFADPDQSFAEDIGTFDFTDKAAPFKPTASMFKMDDSGAKRGLDNRFFDSLKRFDQSFLADTFLNDTDPNSLMYSPAQPGQYKYQGNMFTLNPDGSMVSEAGIPVGEEGKAAILAANLPKVPIPNYGEQDKLPVGAIEQDFASLIADDSDGTPVEPLDLYNLPQSIIDARKMPAPELNFTEDPNILGGFDDDMTPVGDMSSAISEVITPEFDDYFQSPLLEYPKKSDTAPNLNVDETPQEAQARIDAQIERDGYIAAARAEAEAKDNSISIMNREASLDQPNQFPLFTSDNLPSELEQSAAPPAKSGEYGLGMLDILSDLNPFQGDRRIGSDITDLVPENIQDQIDTQIDTLQEGAGLIMDNAGVVGDVLKDTIEMQKLRSEAKTERDGYVAAARDEVEAEAAAKDAPSSALNNISLGSEEAGGGALSGDLTEFASKKDTSIAPLGDKVVKTTTTSATGDDSATGYSDPLRSRIQRMLDEREKSQESDKWLALAQTGMALMSSDSPTLAGAIGEAGLMGLRSLSEARQQYDDDILDLMNMQYKLDVLDQESTTGGLTASNVFNALDDLRDYKSDLQKQLLDLEDVTKYTTMTEDTKEQEKLRIQGEIFRTNLRMGKLRKSVGLGNVQQAANSFDVTGGTQTQSGLDLGTAVS